MISRILVALAAAVGMGGQPPQVPSPATPPELRKLDFLLGEWNANGRAFPEKYGPNAGPTQGHASFRWTIRDTWLLSEFTLDGPLRYGVSVLVAYNPVMAKYSAYAMTNFSPTAVTYEGAWQDESTLVFDGRLDGTGQRRQRVTYQKRPDGRVDFRVVESTDGGATYQRDSELVLEHAPAQPAADHARQSVTAIVTQIQRADYEGDRTALRRLSGELAPFLETEGLAARVRYWRGFALWRRALNGLNDAADAQEVEQDLAQAVIEFERAATFDPALVDAKVGAASCLGSLIFLTQRDAARLQELIPRAMRLLKEAQATAPENPRLLWVQGATEWYVGPERGGGQVMALATYERGLALARKPKTSVSDSLEPSWGEPELLMNLAWSNLHRTTPDVSAAERYAQQALALVPYWHYVRDILMPDIRKAKRETS
jgi:hypothetical protein